MKLSSYILFKKPQTLQTFINYTKTQNLTAYSLLSIFHV